MVCWGHRRRINTEEKAKVVAAVWGTEFIFFRQLFGAFPCSKFDGLVVLFFVYFDFFSDVKRL